MMRSLMPAARRADSVTQEIELLDAEIFEVPRRLSLDEVRDQTSTFHDRRPCNDHEPEDDR